MSMNKNIKAIVKYQVSNLLRKTFDRDPKDYIIGDPELDASTQLSIRLKSDLGQVVVIDITLYPFKLIVQRNDAWTSVLYSLVAQAAAFETTSFTAQQSSDVVHYSKPVMVGSVDSQQDMYVFGQLFVNGSDGLVDVADKLANLEAKLSGQSSSFSLQSHCNDKFTALYADISLYRSVAKNDPDNARFNAIANMLETAIKMFYDGKRKNAAKMLNNVLELSINIKDEARGLFKVSTVLEAYNCVNTM